MRYNHDCHLFLYRPSFLSRLPRLPRLFHISPRPHDIRMHLETTMTTFGQSLAACVIIAAACFAGLNSSDDRRASLAATSNTWLRQP